MRAKPIPIEKQYQLVLECRQSGLSDYNWCLEHDIKPGTFYNWVKRLRKAGTYAIPKPASRDTYGGKIGVATSEQSVKTIQFITWIMIKSIFTGDKNPKP